MTMDKIPTLFLRDPDDRAHVLPEINPDCQWVIDGEGVATRKYDGTCVMLDGDGRWWARREVKPGKTPPPNYQPISTDPVTGKTVGWEPIEQSAFAKFHAEAVKVCGPAEGITGTFELIGPKVNGNPERAETHLFVEHAHALEIDVPERTFDGIRAVVQNLADLDHCEGLVFHHPDGRMAKIKARDFKADAR
jgi:hypothetical protein